MNADVKQKWVAALRSGQYKQGRGRLRQEDKYCCLGVLCDLSPIGTWESVESGIVYFGADVLTPNAVDEWACLYGSQIATLATLNDEGKSFSEIADYIEANL